MNELMRVDAIMTSNELLSLLCWQCCRLQWHC